MPGWYVTCPKFTVLVETDKKAIITQAAPIVRKFMGQHFNRLVEWARRFGVVEFQAIEEVKP